jgi:uncharacterized protein DUF87
VDRVGASVADPNVQTVLSKSIMQRHVFIGGGIGSGKSYTRDVLAEELQAFGICQVNIDVNNAMVDATPELGGVNFIPGDGFTIPLSALSPGDVTAAVPSINPGTNMYTLLQFTQEYLLREVAERKRDYYTVDDLITQSDHCPWRAPRPSSRLTSLDVQYRPRASDPCRHPPRRPTACQETV